MAKKRGAKSKYDALVKPYLDNINKKVREGVTEEAIAKALGISVASLNNYRNKYPEFAEALSKDKGADVLDELVNAGIEAAKGGYKENEQTVYKIDEDGNPQIVQVTVNKVWQQPNATLHKFYVNHYGKDKGFVNDPLEYELKKRKQEFDEALAKKEKFYLFEDK